MRVDNGRLRELRARLQSVESSTSELLDSVVEETRVLLGVDAVGACSLQHTERGLRTAFGHWAGLSKDSRGANATLDASLARQGQFAAYDAFRPERRQRNRIVVFSTLRDLIENPTSHLSQRAIPAAQLREIAARVESHTQMFKEMGIFDLMQMRTLLCEGPRLLAWFGALSETPFRRAQRDLLRTIGEWLQPRLRFESARAAAGLVEAALDACLDALGAPAVLLNRRGAIAHANEAAQQVLEDGSGALGDALDRIRRTGSAPGVNVFDLGERGCPGARLVLLDASRSPATERQQTAVRAWQLTPREGQVLELIVAGDTNRDIAMTLGCAEATVEVHVSRILRKAGVTGRTALVSAYWNPSS